MFAELRTKYEEMRELRRTDDGSYDPRDRMAALAARFPGALREIDTLPLDEIDRRIEALAKAERDPSHAARWMIAQSRFHALTREALASRRARAQTSAGSEGAQSPLAEARGAQATSAEGELEGAALEQEREQKLLARVYATLARELELTPHEAKALVFAREIDHVKITPSIKPKA